MSKDIAESVAEKRGSSIIGLRSVFQKGKKEEVEEAEEGESQDEDEMEEEVEEEVEEKPKKKRVQDKFKERKLNNGKPKMTKKLVWF
jgi:hypothetical protein